MGFNPRVTKCELCNDRLEKGLKPGCTSVCPTGAVIFGPRTVLLLEAKQRIKNNPGRYYQDRVYGEIDNGGTQALYLSRVPFEKLGLPELGTGVGARANAALAETLLPVLRAARAACMSGLVQVIRKSLKGHEEEAHEREKETGLRAQL